MKIKRRLLYIISALLLLCIFIPTNVSAYDPITTPNNIYGIGIINHSDLTDVSNLVNVNGGDWGYVTIVITENDRNKETWQKFLNDCRNLHLIPIVRVATSFEGQNWKAPKVEDIDAWISFFDSLNWVIKNRYIVIGNEPNHSKEWGGKIDPAEYSIYLKTFADKLHNANSDYFVLNAGFDQAAPNSKNTLDQKRFMDLMVKTTPDVFNVIDGWSSHSYPNPAFSGSKLGVGRKSIRGYEWEIDYLSRLGVKKSLPIFITETGWIRNDIKDEIKNAENLKYAFEEVWMKSKNVVAVTPFILNYQSEPFYDFSWKNKDGSYFPIYGEIQKLQKTKGIPIQKITGEVIFSFLNPLMLRGSEQKGFSIVKNTGQATWTQGEANVINESSNEVKVYNTKFSKIEPFSNGLVTFIIKTPNSDTVNNIKLGFYVQGERIGDIFSGKIISF